MTENVVQIPQKASIPIAQDGKNFDPETKKVKMQEGGVAVTWDNQDSAAHTVTSGNPETGPDGKWDSGIFLSNSKFTHTIQEPGEYEYFCVVHPWKKGKIIVEE
jgi:plastocyanin